MAVFAIGDLHLPGHDQKPMDIFGQNWDHHAEKIVANWLAAVQVDDLVLLPGDFSWAMQLMEARDDLLQIASLPGQKVLLRGNHDYWWSTPAKIRTILPDTMALVQNDAFVWGEYVICGTRGWMIPTEDTPLKADDLKIYQRELIRLDLSLKAAEKHPDKERIVMMHFPPLLPDGASTGFTDILEAAGVKLVVYGHLHGQSIHTAFNGEKNGVTYRLVSADALDFMPFRLLP